MNLEMNMMDMERVLNSNKLSNFLEKAESAVITVDFRCTEEHLKEVCKEYILKESGVSELEIEAFVWDDCDGYGKVYSFVVKEDSVSKEDWEKLYKAKIHEEENVLEDALYSAFSNIEWVDVEVEEETNYDAEQGKPIIENKFFVKVAYSKIK